VTPTDCGIQIVRDRDGYQCGRPASEICCDCGTPLCKAHAESDVQRQILDYLVLKHIFHYRNNSGAVAEGAGGMGEVYRARDSRLGPTSQSKYYPNHSHKIQIAFSRVARR